MFKVVLAPDAYCTGVVLIDLILGISGDPPIIHHRKQAHITPLMHKVR